MTENHGYGDQRRDEPRERLLRAQWNCAGSSCAGAVRGRRADRELGAWCRAIQLGTLNWTNRVGGLKASQFETVRQGWLHSLEPGWARAASWATRTNMRLPVPISWYRSTLNARAILDDPGDPHPPALGAPNTGSGSSNVRRRGGV